jgi:signal transduction histidine kinase
VSNTYEWCNEDIEPVLHLSQQIPLGEWYDLIEERKYIRLSSSNKLEPVVAEAMELRGNYSALAIPLSGSNVHYGFIGFDDCRSNRRWERNEINLLISISQIITNTMRRYRAETAMRLSQQTMRTVLDNIDASIFVSDFNSSEILFANKKIKDRTGDIEGHRCWEMMQKGMKGPCSFCPKANLRDCHNQPTGPYHWEHRNTNNQNWYACSDAAIKWVDGRWVHLEYATNITQRKKAEIELLLAKEKAEESDKLKSAFLANMSHEVRTPLNGITGFINFMEDDNLPPKRRRHYIDIINTGAAQLTKLIDDIVDIATIESEQMNLLPIAFRLNDFMEDMFTHLDTKLYYSGKSHTAFVLDREGFIDRCVCFIDSIRLRQILINLIDNAFKYLDKGYIRFGYRQKEAGLLEFVVEDTGVGIPKSQQEVIFERFRQGEQDIDRRYGGAGLGLTISRSLSKMMGGDIRVESTEGFGSTFYFTVAYLPVIDADTRIFDLLAEMPVNAVDLFVNKTVLVAESVDLNYIYYEKILSASGFNVVRVDMETKLIAQNTKAHAIVVSLSGTDSTMLDNVQQYNIPVIYITPGQPDEYRRLIQNDPNSILLAAPANYQTITNTLKMVLRE